MFANNIVWDIDLEPGENYEEVRAELSLPKCVELPKWLQLDDAALINGCHDFDDDISDWLSNEYGYCVQSFSVA